MYIILSLPNPVFFFNVWQDHQLISLKLLSSIEEIFFVLKLYSSTLMGLLTVLQSLMIAAIPNVIGWLAISFAKVWY